ncbi:hypothetical protein ETU10_07550 [Apibacter muscae]|uniref:primase-helicase family protein n=1 Tax=Apibacter muscae TaxID=2509004 RepID=UPI0011ABA47A|nr:primase-helicase family protein [Apibacter muscae]TWP23569.1 hypothetical protein ETU10_07550 [Apibacter muscae]
MENRLENNEEPIQFWTNEGKIKIKNVLFINFLQSLGYRKLRNKNEYELVRIISGSIVQSIPIDKVREEVKDHLLSLDRQEVLEVFLNKDHLSKTTIESLEGISIDFIYGDKNTAILFYKNGVLKINANELTLISYMEYKGYVWEDQIIPRDFILPETKDIDKDCEFGKFCKNISGNKQERLFSLKTILGYLLHSYKDPSFTKAIILIDEIIDLESNASEGGTGKSLLAKSINQLIPVLEKNGKLLKSNDKFFFADVEPHHKVIVFDDVKQDFSFESLYSMITGDMPIEKKYKNPVVMNFKEVPKVLITSNYLVRGTGGNSEARRKIVFEVNSHYRENPNIREESGHRFFDDWNEEQWMKFDYFMIDCVQLFLNNGIIEPESINEITNRLILETSKEFVCFIGKVLVNPSNYEAEIKEKSIRFNKAVLMEKFLQEFPEQRSKISPHLFTKWLEHYSKVSKINFKNQKSNGQNFIIFMI